MVNDTMLNITESIGVVKPQSLVSALDPFLLTFLFIIVLVVVVLVFVFRKVAPISHFLYADARVHARTKFMVSDSLLQELTEAKSLNEFRSLLRETSYAEKLESADENLKSFHLALEQSLVESLLELLELSPKKAKPLLGAYLMFFESKILKLFYRARFVGAGVDSDIVFPIGNINNILLKHLLETKTIKDIAIVMDGTIYSQVFKKEYKSLEEFEVTLEQFVFNNFVETIRKTRMYDGIFIIDIMNKKIDIANILALLRFRIRNIEKERQKSLLVYNNSELCLKFNELIGSKDIKEFVNRLKGLPYYDSMVRAYEKYEKDKNLVNFETELFRYFKSFIIENELGHTLGPYPLFSYLIKKELELRNLFVISRGIDAKFDAEKIRELIV